MSYSSISSWTRLRTIVLIMRISDCQCTMYCEGGGLPEVLTARARQSRVPKLDRGCLGFSTAELVTTREEKLGSLDSNQN